MKNAVLIPNGYVAIPSGKSVLTLADLSAEQKANIATLSSNLATYGYVLSRAALESLGNQPRAALGKWWAEVRLVLAEITGANRKMDDYMVYKNFPREVLEMSQIEQVVHQLLIYFGVPSEALTEDEKARPPLGDMQKLKVLAPADADTSVKIFANLVAMRNRWSDNQTIWSNELYPHTDLDLDAFGFKENGIALIAKHIFADFAPKVSISTATDVLRLAAALSEQDISLRQKVVFRKFKRAERRALLAILEGAQNIDADFAARPGISKRLLERLRPGDYKAQFPNVTRAYDNLYNKRVKSFNALVDPQTPGIEMLVAVESRPGEFLRRFHHLYGLFGAEAVVRFAAVLPKLTTRQLVGFRAYLTTINGREKLMFPPKANWARAQIVDNKKVKIDPTTIWSLDATIGGILRERLGTAFPEGFGVDPAVSRVKLQTNDQKLAEYGRGTVFDIPENITFVRSASYWENAGSTTWFDNGWNFFDENWSERGSVAWNNQHGPDKASIFSGDPVNSKNLNGRACQMADLYLDKLRDVGVRYAVWNILCYSRVKFSDATGEVLATLQWGENAETGKTYEPSRAQMVFPLKSDALTSYVAYIDVVERKLVYMDAPLRGKVLSASYNGAILSEQMPAYVEYLKSLPSVYDLVKDAPEGGMPVRYDDADEAITNDRAFVFRAENSDSTFKRVTVTDLVEAA